KYILFLYYKQYTLVMPKPKSVMTGSSNVKMNVNSSSRTKNATNNAISTVIRSNRTHNAKRKVILVMRSNKGSNVNNNE
ncbi:3847_t:CDS:1, partial [Gigaspora margarita]